jgi:RimJ/RimL family protein N-acetyltransferase
MCATFASSGEARRLGRGLVPLDKRLGGDAVRPFGSGRTPSNDSRGSIGVAALAGAGPVFRAVRREDAAMLQAFVRGLSVTSRRRRFWSTLHELPPSLLEAFTDVDNPRQFGLVAEVSGPSGCRIVADARYVGEADGRDAEVAIVVADAWQRRGLGRRMLRLLQDAAHAADYDRLFGMVESDNDAMRALARSSGFSRVGPSDEPGADRFECRLPRGTLEHPSALAAV